MYFVTVTDNNGKKQMGYFYQVQVGNGSSTEEYFIATTQAQSKLNSANVLDNDKNAEALRQKVDANFLQDCQSIAFLPAEESAHFLPILSPEQKKSIQDVQQELNAKYSTKQFSCKDRQQSMGVLIKKPSYRRKEGEENELVSGLQGSQSSVQKTQENDGRGKTNTVRRNASTIPLQNRQKKGAEQKKQDVTRQTSSDLQGKQDVDKGRESSPVREKSTKIAYLQNVIPPVRTGSKTAKRNTENLLPQYIVIREEIDGSVYSEEREYERNLLERSASTVDSGESSQQSFLQESTVNGDERTALMAESGVMLTEDMQNVDNSKLIQELKALQERYNAVDKKDSCYRQDKAEAVGELLTVLQNKGVGSTEFSKVFRQKKAILQQDGPLSRHPWMFGQSRSQGFNSLVKDKNSELGKVFAAIEKAGQQASQKSSMTKK